MSELAFFTNQELIDELLRRQTFLGVVVQSEDEHRDRDWGGDKYFKVRFNNNLKPLQACRLLAVVADHIDRNAC